MTTVIDPLLEANKHYAQQIHEAKIPAAPARKLAVVTCMDARIMTLEAFGLQAGDAHIMRNAGGRVTEDTIRSLAVSCAVYGTGDIVVAHHTDCGMAQPPEALAAQIAQVTGQHPEGMELHAIEDAPAALRHDVDAIHASPLIPDDVRVWGMRYHIAEGLLRLECASGPPDDGTRAG